MIQETSLNELEAHLTKLGVQQGDNLVLHSSLFAFGRLKFDLDEMLTLILKMIGSQGTLIVPTYTFNLGPNDLYDPKLSQSDGVGVLSEIARKHPMAIRSQCPIHNHAAIGPLAMELLNSSELDSFGKDSDFNFFYTKNFKLVLLGTDFKNGCTYLHHVEAVTEVPYREWIKTKRQVLIDGNKRHINCNYFARAQKIKVTDFNRVIPALEETSNLLSEKAPYGYSYCISARVLHQVATEMIKQDPYCFIRE